MPVLAQGNTANLTLGAHDSITLQNRAGQSASLTVAGTLVNGQHSGTRTYGPYANGGAVVLVATAGDVYYEVGDGAYAGVSNALVQVDTTGRPIRTVTAGGQVVGGSGLYAALNEMSGVVAFWDFTEARAPFVSKVGAPHKLIQAPGSRVRKSNGGPLGHSIVLNGSTDYLYIPAAECGSLNIGRNGGNACYVAAWVKRSSNSSGDFVAGIWRENNNNPGRQYGLFLDLPTYGGDNKVCMHISRRGGASPGLPFSRDYSANRAQEPGPDWVHVSGSYDGVAIRSYIEGRFEPYTNYTEPGAPDGQGLTYDKNPYIYPDGMNDQLADFTVGSVELTSGMGNFFGGEIAALLVMNRAPSIAEVARIQMLISGAGWGFKNRLYGWADTPLLTTAVNQMPTCRAYLGATATDTSSSTASTAAYIRTNSGVGTDHGYILRQTGSTGIALFTCEDVPAGITTDNLDAINVEMAFANTADTARICVRIGGAWYASNTAYTVANAAPNATDWTNAEVKKLSFSLAGANWRDVTLTPGSALSVAGSPRDSALPSGAIQGWGILTPTTPAGSQRFRNVEFLLLAAPEV